MNDKPHKATQDFTALVNAVRRVHDTCAAAVNRTVNTTLTLRNWFIGGYIRDYEQNGSDRAQYGIRLLEKLSESLQGCLDRCYTGRYLGLCRQLFDAYPSIRKSVISESGSAFLPEILEPTVARPETRKSVISELGADSPEIYLPCIGRGAFRSTDQCPDQSKERLIHSAGTKLPTNLR
jgi:hypothetical protein